MGPVLNYCSQKAERIFIRTYKDPYYKSNSILGTCIMMNSRKVPRDGMGGRRDM